MESLGIFLKNLQNGLKFFKSLFLTGNTNQTFYEKIHNFTNLDCEAEGRRNLSMIRIKIVFGLPEFFSKENMPA